MWVSGCVWKTHEHVEHTVQTFFFDDRRIEKCKGKTFDIIQSFRARLSYTILTLSDMPCSRYCMSALKEEIAVHMNVCFVFFVKEIFLWFMEWARHPSKRSEDLPKCTSSSPRHKSYFLLSRTRTNIRRWWIGQSNNGGTLIQNWYKDISLVTIWSRSSRGCWQEAFWHSLQAIWGALIESAATISQQWISALKEVAAVGCEESGCSVCSDRNKEFIWSYLGAKICVCDWVTF